ncbi:aminopeptidase, partial [Coemansia erecta]
SSVVLRGTPSEASSQSLTGRVLFRLGHSLKVKTITAVFQSVGSSKQQLQPQAASSQVRIEQVLFDASNLPRGYAAWKSNYYGCDTSSYEFPFSFVVAGHLHESVNTSFGGVGYELKVTIQTCGFGINTWSESLKIPVFRIPKEGTPQALRLTDPLRMQADWLGAVELRVLRDTVAMADNSKMRARVVICPLQKGLQLADVGLRLSETVCHKTATDKFGDPRSYHKVISERRKATEDPAIGLGPLPLSQEHSLTLSLPVPKAFSGIQYTMDTPQVSIVHELVLTATVIDRDQNPRHLRISSHVCVVPKPALEDTFAELPAYSSTGHDRLLLGSSAVQLDQPPSFSSLLPPSYRSATV